jgi:hypothetical protein
MGSKMDDAVRLLQGIDFLTSDGTGDQCIELLPHGFERMKQAQAMGRSVIVDTNGVPRLLRGEEVRRVFVVKIPG